MLLNNIKIGMLSVPAGSYRANQDACFAEFDRDTGIVIAGVCDGVGSNAGSEDASQCVSAVIRKELKTAKPESIVTDMFMASFWAREELKNRSIASSTTATYLIVFPDGKMFVANIGDSRVYKFRDDKLTMLTLDDRPKLTLESLGIEYDREFAETISACKSEAEINQVLLDMIPVRSEMELQRLLENQTLLSAVNAKTKEEFAQLPNNILSMFNSANVILRSVNASDTPICSITTSEVKSGDKLFLCSDGISDVHPTDLLEEILGYELRDPSDMCSALVRMANANVKKNVYCGRNKVDDKTAVVIYF